MGFQGPKILWSPLENCCTRISLPLEKDVPDVGYSQELISSLCDSRLTGIPPPRFASLRYTKFEEYRSQAGSRTSWGPAVPDAHLPPEEEARSGRTRPPPHTRAHTHMKIPSAWRVSARSAWRVHRGVVSARSAWRARRGVISARSAWRARRGVISARSAWHARPRAIGACTPGARAAALLVLAAPGARAVALLVLTAPETRTAALSVLAAPGVRAVAFLAG